MTRAEAIEILKHWKERAGSPIDASRLGYIEEWVYKEDIEALEMAISSLETDEAYRLEYEPTTNNDLGVASELEKNSKKLEKDFGELDCISRAQTQTEIEMNASRYTIAKERGGMGQVEWSDQLIKVSDAVDIIRNMPSVTPQEPKTGHWKPYLKEWLRYQCSACDSRFNTPWEYCPHCGAKMVEPQESEE